MSEKLQKNIGYGKRNKFYFIETSAKENINVDAIFDYIAHQIYDMFIDNNFMERF